MPVQASQPPFRGWTSARAVGVALATAWAASALAQVPAIYRDADLKLGEQLIAQNQCVQCHVQKVGGDGNAIYRPLGRINTAGLLRGMVEQCNSMLNLQMFPEEVTAVAAVLNRDHYKFKD
jgi:mono/diheme cytochrome c family protein